uniref:Protein kinase domain-containing protein n=1 Tax=Parascaris univalens TaxID=6257 RepID=A0A915C9A3_PARUN
MVFQGSLSASTSADTSGRIVVDESDYRLEEDKLPFEIKEVVRIRANEKFSKYYECFDEIGEGKFGKVYRCREKATGLELAAKRIKIRRDADRAQVEKEVAIMTQMRHPRIAQIYDAFSTPDNDIILVMEVVRGGELFDRVVDDNYILTEMAVVMIVCQLCEAVSYIHSKNIVHLDIKPENIMCVSQTGNRIKLIDFGLAQYYDGSSNLLFMAGTPEFVAPEVIKFEPIDFHTDMWSIGVITYILLSGISPFLGETLGDTYCAVEKGEWEFDEEAFEGISEAAKDFISKLLVYDQKKRMLPEQCLQHEWIVGSRARAANDLLLSQPNVGKPLSKEDGIGPSTRMGILSKSEAGNVNQKSKTAPTPRKQSDGENEAVEKLLSAAPKKVKGNAISCETPEKKAKVEEEAKSLPKPTSNFDTKQKRNTDGCRRDDSWQTNLSRNRPSIDTSSEINRKANSVAAILSKFAEKDEVSAAPKHLERKSSRAGRTLRDVERPLKKMSSVLIDDLPPPALAQPLEEVQSRSENLKNAVKVRREETETNVEQSYRNDKCPPMDAFSASRVSVDSAQTTHDGDAPLLRKDVTTDCSKSSVIDSYCRVNEATPKSCDAARGNNIAVSKAEKGVKEKSVKSSLDKHTGEIHCTSMIIPMKVEKNSTVIVKTKTSIRSENKTSEKSVTKAVNGQLIEESHRSEKNDTSIDVRKSMTKHNRGDHVSKPTVENDSRIAQFRSVALRAEMQKKTTASHEKGETTMELTKAEKTHIGKVNLVHEKKLNNTCISTNSATAKNEIQDTAVAKKITSTLRCALEPYFDESLTLNHKENFASNTCFDGKISTKETSKKSSVKISNEKPPSGRSDKRSRTPKKTDVGTLVFYSDGSKGSASEIRNNHSDESNAETSRSIDPHRYMLSASTTSLLDTRKNGRTVASRASSDASSESSDHPSGECEKNAPKASKSNQVSYATTKEPIDFSSTSSSMPSKSPEVDLISPYLNRKTEVIAGNALLKPKIEVTTVSKNESSSMLTLLPSQKENFASVEMDGKIAVKDVPTKISTVKKKKATALSVADESCSDIFSSGPPRAVFEKTQVNSSRTSVVENETSKAQLRDAFVGMSSVVADAKRKSTKKGKNIESSSEEETKKPKLSSINTYSKQEYERRQKRVGPKLSWRSELLKSFDDANKKRGKAEGENQIPKTSYENYSPTTDPTSSWNHGKDGYGSDGECMKRPSLKPITSEDKKKMEYRSLANIPSEVKTQKDGKLSKRKVTFSNEVLDPKPIAIKISSIPGFALSRVQSESNIAEKAKISLENTLKIRRMTMDDAKAEELKTITTRREMLVQQGRYKKPEVSNFGWLKTQLESRIIDEKRGQTWKSKSELKIPISASQNAKRALDMWKNME